MKLEPKQAEYVLEVLVARRKVRAAQIRSLLKEREAEITALRRRLASLEGAAGGAGASAGARKGAARSRRSSPKLRALRRMQGRYMGFVRGLKPSEKARVRAVREKKGLGPAIRLASSLGRS
jgi:hypothetical protein